MAAAAVSEWQYLGSLWRRRLGLGKRYAPTDGQHRAHRQRSGDDAPPHATEAVTHRSAGVAAGGLLCRQEPIAIGFARPVPQSGQRKVPTRGNHGAPGKAASSNRTAKTRPLGSACLLPGGKVATTWRRTIPSLDDAPVCAVFAENWAEIAPQKTDSSGSSCITHDYPVHNWWQG